MADYHAYELKGGPCHWDLELTFAVMVTHAEANKVGADQVEANCKKFAERLKKSFDKFFNPKRGNNETEYSFGSCPCTFHIDATFEVVELDPNTDDPREKAKKLGDHLGIVVIDSNHGGHKGHADIGGQVFQIQEEDIDNSTLPHEIGHILGLPDRYMTGLKGDTNTPTTEAQYTGTLMGKINPQGTGKPQRQLTQDDIEDIAKSTGMTCDAKKCCPRKSEEKKGYTGTQEKEKKPEEPKTGR